MTVAEEFSRLQQALRDSQRGQSKAERRLREIGLLARTRHTFTSHADHAAKLSNTLAAIARLSEKL